MSEFDISSFSMTRDYINFQTDCFPNFEQFKTDSHFAYFQQIEIDHYSLFLLTVGRSQFFLLYLGKTLDCEKQPKPSPFNKKFKNHA